MTELDREREDALRRLLADAVEPVRPAPGAQARLLARARESQTERRSQRVRLAWAGAALCCIAAIVAVPIAFAGRTGDSGGSSAASAPSRASAAPDNDAPRSGSATVAPSAASPQSSEQGARASSKNAQEFTLLAARDLDGDGKPDLLSIVDGQLRAQLTQDGNQQVTLPDVGPGARVLGVALLHTDSGGPDAAVPAAFVRIRDENGVSQDVIAVLVDRRLTLLRLGENVAKLRIEGGAGYYCDQQLLAISADGRVTFYDVSGHELISGLSASGKIMSGAASGCVA